MSRNKDSAGNNTIDSKFSEMGIDVLESKYFGKEDERVTNEEESKQSEETQNDSSLKEQSAIDMNKPLLAKPNKGKTKLLPE